MIFEKIGSTITVVLDEGEKAIITNRENFGKTDISVESSKDGLNISGNPDLVSSMFEDDSLTSKEEILEKCDKWLEDFEAVFNDYYNKMSSNGAYKKNNVYLKLCYPKFYNVGSKTSTRGIELSLRCNSMDVQEGISIYVDEQNEDIYNYLVFRTLSHYVKNCFLTIDVKMDDDYVIKSIYPKLPCGSPMFIADTSNFTNSRDLIKIKNSVIINHNVGEDAYSMQDNLRKRITSQELCDSLKETFDKYEVTPKSLGQKVD